MMHEMNCTFGTFLDGGPDHRTHHRAHHRTHHRGDDVTTVPALEIARQASLRPIVEIAGQMGLPPELLEHYGAHVAKISLDAVSELADRPTARYVVVTAITPTPLGEGKTTTTVGLGQALALIGKQATIAIRQASMGPTFGIKGGAAGGGYSQVVPFETLNLHLTGDLHAVTAANNLLAAMVDNHIHHGNALGLDPHSITWRRVLDVNDRSLRNVVGGLGRARTARRESPASTSPPPPRSWPSSPWPRRSRTCGRASAGLSWATRRPVSR